MPPIVPRVKGYTHVRGVNHKLYGETGYTEIKSMGTEEFSRSYGKSQHGLTLSSLGHLNGVMVK